MHTVCNSVSPVLVTSLKLNVIQLLRHAVLVCGECVPVTETIGN